MMLATISLRTATTSEPPAGGAVRLDAGDRVERRRRDLVHVPRRRTGAGRTELVPERAVADLGTPVVEQLRDALELGFVANDLGLALGLDVDAGRSDADHAPRVVCEIPALLRSRPRAQVEPAAVPHDADCHDMR